MSESVKKASKTSKPKRSRSKQEPVFEHELFLQQAYAAESLPATIFKVETVPYERESNTDDEAEKTSYMRGRKKIGERASNVIPEVLLIAAKKTSQELSAYSNALDEGPASWAERKFKQRPEHLGELTPLARELIMDS